MCLRPTIAPKATEHIDHIIRFVQRLIDQGKAYHVPGGGCIFFPFHLLVNMEKLSPNRNPDDMQAGAPDCRGREKEKSHGLHPCGNRPNPESLPGTAPGGKGRPGWHIECSAMSYEYLGESFDIHGGGKDLIFSSP